jgi:hypothetical protein
MLVRTKRVGSSSALALGLLSSLLCRGARADVTWPAEQLLPSFSAPAPKQELIYLRGPSSTAEELPLFASLKGVVNAKQPRIFSYEGDALAEGAFTWLESLKLTWTEHTDNWPLIEQFKAELKGLVVYDPALPDTLNLATTIAGQKQALVAAPALVAKLSAAPYGLPVIEDLRGRFSNKLEVYESLLANQWPSAPQRVLIGLNPAAHKSSLREYAVALGAAVIWLDPKVAGESELLDRFLETLGPGHAFMGWWPEEQAGVQRASEHGVATVASDFATNLTLHGGMPRTFEPKVIPPKPRLENKKYVAFMLSDGDNLQFVEHLMRKLWNDPARGQVPIGWTVSPAMLDAMPGALAYYAASATPGDALISGPSGWGYAYPNSWPSAAQLEQFAARTDDYARRAGLRVVSIWNTITGGIDADVGQTFASHAPSLLGLTGQNTGGGLTVYSASLPGFALSCNYCTGEQAMKDHIAGAAQGWDGQEPRFILIQAQPWQNVTPTTFRQVQDSLDDTYAVVRPDHWFQLLRQAEGLRIEPIQPIGPGVYRLVSDASGKCVTASSAASGATVEQRECADDAAQRWRVEPTQAGYARLVSMMNEQLVLALEGGGAATADGAKARLASAAETLDQQWQPIWEAGDRYHVLARLGDRCLDVPSGSLDDVELQQWECNGASAQVFRFASPTPEPPVGGGGAGGVAGSANMAGLGGVSGNATGQGGNAGAAGQAELAGGGAASSVGAAGGSPPKEADGTSGGCDCRLPRPPAHGSAALVAVGMLVWLHRSRRQRSR